MPAATRELTLYTIKRRDPRTRRSQTAASPEPDVILAELLDAGMPLQQAVQITGQVMEMPLGSRAEIRGPGGIVFTAGKRFAEPEEIADLEDVSGGRMAV